MFTTFFIIRLLSTWLVLSTDEMSPHLTPKAAFLARHLHHTIYIDLIICLFSLKHSLPLVFPSVSPKCSENLTCNGWRMTDRVGGWTLRSGSTYWTQSEWDSLIRTHANMKKWAAWIPARRWKDSQPSGQKGNLQTFVWRGSLSRIHKKY